MAIITGTNLQDLLFGTASADTIDGLQDNDTIFGRTGADIINGGGGNDLASGDEGDDQVNGDGGDDTLLGGEGNDTVNGGAGNDVIDGGVGNDVLGGDNNNDTILGGAGDDTLNGDDGADILDGGLGVNTVSGGLGDDKIYSFVGTDLLRGAENNDTYFFGDDGAARTVTVEDLDGINTFDLGLAFPGASIDLRGANVSTVGNLQIVRSAGTVIQNVLGTDFGDSIWGDGQSNFIDGRIGGDYMEGGLGGDTYRVDSQFDTVIEAAGEGVDTIETTVSLTLSDAQEIETLVLLGTDNLTGEGNGIANSIVGNSGHNTIDGLGGDDVMIGGLGNDAYYLDSSLDIIAEDAGEGTDTAYASQNYVLAANVENLVLLGGSLDLTGNGNSLNNVITGNDGGNQINGFSGADTMSGGLGNDTYVVDNLNDIVTEAANAGDNDRVQSSVSYTLTANVERLELLTNNALSGTGNTLNNTLIGNNAFNALTGGSGNDVLDGRGGGDNMIGGTGNDSYIVDNAADAAIELFNQGIDSVTSSVSFTLGTDVENLTLTGTAANGTGNILANRITGNNSANTLTGGDGNDTLDGGLGNDTMDGGSGADTYFVNSTGDVIIEAASSGIDTVNSSVTRTLEADVEKLFLTGTANINGTGNALDNRLVGNAGNNNLLGLVGADTMIGGLGNDFYEVDDLGDVVTELSGEGIDGVNASITYFLPNHVEILQLLNGGAAANGFGNTLDNQLYGNDADNNLDGKGGADRMLGGLGDDIYIVDNLGDTVIENPGQGYDAVSSSVTFTLGANLEQLNLTGTAASNGTGNTLANVMNGNGAANTLNGMTGADTMTGGNGNDVYIVDNAGDAVVEAAGAGTGSVDRVESSITYTLVANVEHLTLTGAANRNGTGNGAGNVIIGNSGNNTLTGDAGLDTLTGGAGLDRFAFANTALGTDTITDFNTADDLIQVSAAGFGGGLVAGGAVTLQSSATPVAVGGGGQFLYDTDTGNLSFDADGAGGAAAVVFARLTNLAPIAAVDFVVVA
jgi:Ca2+-binding RTX toxin-like protein